MKEIEANLVEEFKNSISQDLQETQKNDFEPNSDFSSHFCLRGRDLKI